MWIFKAYHWVPGVLLTGCEHMNNSSSAALLHCSTAALQLVASGRTLHQQESAASGMLTTAWPLVAVQVRARDQESKWLTALALMDDDTYLAADNSSNMVSHGPFCTCACKTRAVFPYHRCMSCYCASCRAQRQ
jgi:hypothetical protein